ncbi:hypothetical protein [Actinosynnema sp. NPDC020468]|uniref:hypothetical protein n=1 Tax=Actinosynnema sp. NPDC020468 TaxID=3154488 RepID=UPI0033D5AB26
MRWWKFLGLAGIAGVTATGVVIARAERKRRAYTPDEIRERLHERLAQAAADATTSAAIPATTAATTAAAIPGAAQGVPPTGAPAPSRGEVRRPPHGGSPGAPSGKPQG